MSPAVVNTVGHVVINSAMEIRSLSERLSSMTNSEAGLVAIRDDVNAITSKVESMISSLHQNLAFANQGMNADIHQIFEMKATRFFSLFDGILWAPKKSKVEWDHVQHAQTIDLIMKFDPRIVQMHVVSMLGNRKLTKDSVESREDAYQSCIRIESRTGQTCRVRVEFFNEQQTAHREDHHIVLPLFSGIETEVSRIKDGTKTRIQVSFDARFLNEHGSGFSDLTSVTTAERRPGRRLIPGPSSKSHFEIAGLDMSSSSAASGEDAHVVFTLDGTQQISERTLMPSLRRLTMDQTADVDNHLTTDMSPRHQQKPGTPPHRTILKNERHLILGPTIAKRDKDVSTAAGPAARPAANDEETHSTIAVRGPPTQLPPLPPRIKVRSVTGSSVGGGGGRITAADFSLPEIKTSRKPSAFSVRDRGVPSVKVLVVDDEIACIKFVVHALVQIPDVVTRTASDGIEAIRQACQFFPDIIFMDISMPQCDGLDAASRIHQVYGLCNLDPPEIYIVSANLDSVNRIKKNPESYAFVSAAFEKPLERRRLQNIVLDRVTKTVGSP